MKKWVRSRDGLIAGICEGLGVSLDISPWLLRAIWLLAVFAFGSGILLYFMFWFSLPRVDRHESQIQKKFLGVCYRLSKKMDMDVGLVRFITLTCFLSSFGVAILLYLVLNFTLEVRSPIERR